LKYKRILLFIPLVWAISTLSNTWIQILTSGSTAVWQHYSALILLAILIGTSFRGFTATLIATGIFLLIGVFGGYSLTVPISSTTIRVGSLLSFPFNAFCLMIFSIYLLLNGYTLVKIYMEKKERELDAPNHWKSSPVGPAK